MANKVKTICIDCGKEKEIIKRSLWRIKVGGRSGRCLKCASKLRNSDPEYKKKLSAGMKGHVVSEETRIKIGNAHRGKIISEEHKKKISRFFKDRPVSKEHRMALSKAHRLYQTEETRQKISRAKEGVLIPSVTGKNHYRWIENRMLLKDDSRERGGQLHREWSKTVKDRDNWKCKISNQDCEGRMEAHHILGWSKHPELRYEINNGITLCHAHHPRKRVEEKQMIPVFQGLLGLSMSN